MTTIISTGALKAANTTRQPASTRSVFDFAAYSTNELIKRHWQEVALPLLRAHGHPEFADSISRAEHRRNLWPAAEGLAAYVQRPQGPMTSRGFVELGSLAHDVLACAPNLFDQSGTPVQRETPPFVYARSYMTGSPGAFSVGETYAYRRDFGKAVREFPGREGEALVSNASFDSMNFVPFADAMELYDAIVSVGRETAEQSGESANFFPVYVRFPNTVLPTSEENRTNVSIGMQEQWLRRTEECLPVHAMVSGVVTAVRTDFGLGKVVVTITGDRQERFEDRPTVPFYPRVGKEQCEEGKVNYHVDIPLIGEVLVEVGKPVLHGEVIGTAVSKDLYKAYPPGSPQVFGLIEKLFNCRELEAWIDEACSRFDVADGEFVFRPYYLCSPQAIRRSLGLYERALIDESTGNLQIQVVQTTQQTADGNVVSALDSYDEYGVRYLLADASVKNW